MSTSRNRNILSIGMASPKEFKTATLAMGCFWSPDALFGSLDGVIRTRVGYAGGSTENPTYRNLADHIETVQLDYEPSKISYQDLLDIFFNHHKPIAAPWKRQYMSALFYHDKEQEKLIGQAIEKLSGQLGRKIYTGAFPYHEFYLAEDRHQKYKLQRQPGLMEDFTNSYPTFTDIINSTTAARVNGYLYGYGKREELKARLNSFGLSPAGQEALLDKARDLKEVPRCAG